tara:strand:- start:11775 stop:15332 length:3558 start_codon:yes stop_codon:yes gene_type:complete
MSFHKWSGLDSEFAHENEQIIELARTLNEWSDNAEKEVHLLTNFYIAAEEIDALIILPKSDLIVIDLKTGSGKITGEENGDWFCEPEDGDRFKINKGRKNPLNQARSKRFAVMNYMNNRKNEIFSSQKAPQMDFVHTKSIIAFSDLISWDNNQLPSSYFGWFDVLALEEITEKLKVMKSQKLDLNTDEAWKIPTLLSLNNEDNDLKNFDKNETVTEIVDVVIDTENIVDEKTEIENNLIYEKGLNKLVKGSFSGIKEKKINIKLSNGEEKGVRLNTDFKGTVEQLEMLSIQRKMLIEKDEIEINLINVNYEKGEFQLVENSLLVIEPEWLINVTSLTQFDYCERSLFNQRYSIQSQNEFMMKGSIIHEVFETILVNNDEKKIEDNLNESLNKRALEFPLTGINPGTMVQAVQPHIEALSDYVENQPITEKIDIASERFIINPKLGLKGKIDAVIYNVASMKAIELKTGKTYGGKVKDGHAFQAQAYSLLMEDKYDQSIKDPTVLYSGDHPFTTNLGKKVPFDYTNKAHVMYLRNKLVLADYLFELEYTDNPRKCDPCGQQQICKDLFMLEIDHDNNNLPLYRNELLDKKWSNEEKQIFYNYNKLLTEEYRVIKEIQGEYFCKKIEERISNLKCVEINNWKGNNNNEYILYCENKSEIRESDAVLISDDKGPVDGECIEAYVKTVSKNNIIINTRVKIDESTFRPRYIDKYDSETAFERNYAAIYELLNNPNLNELKEILIKSKKAGSNHLEEIAVSSDFEEYKMQDNSVRIANGIENFLLIKGPPGTGKTVTIARIIEQLKEKGKTIIVSCYTHRAVDEVIKKVKKYAPNIDLYKVGSRVYANENEDSGNLLEKEIKKEVNLGNRIKKAVDIIDSAPVFIGTTHAWLSGRYDNLMLKQGNDLFDIAILDEASQIILPSVLGVVRLAKKFILVGDDKQLPPVTQSELAKDLEKTLFESLYNEYHNDPNINNVTLMLDIQHRMAEPIANFISNEFYEGNLKTSENCKKQQLKIELNQSDLKDIIDPNQPMTLVHTKTSAIVPRDRTSPHEVEIITDILNNLIQCGVSPENIGIIAPYRAQVAEIRRSIEEKLHEAFFSSNQGNRIVDTVDRFQGDERDIIIFSLCLLHKDIPRIYQDTRRINVAISRAKFKFIGVGNWDIVGNSKVFSSLLKYVRENEACSFVNWKK